MTYEEALQEALTRAKRDKRTVFVCYDAAMQSPDWRNRYRVSEYLGYPAAHPKDVKARVEPTGEVVLSKYIVIRTGSTQVGYQGDLETLRAMAPDITYSVEREEPTCIYVTAYPKTKRRKLWTRNA